jgi:site-specific recombinase XerD
LQRGCRGGHAPFIIDPQPGPRQRRRHRFHRPHKGRWIARVTIDVTRCKRTASTEAQAKRLICDLRRDADEGATPTQGNITVRQLLEDWSTTALPARNLAPRTIEMNQRAVAKLIEMPGSKRLRPLSASEVEKTFREGGYSRKSSIERRSILGRAFDYALRRKLVTSDIARHVELLAEAPSTEPGRALTIEQAKVLLARAEERRLHPVWLIMLTLGLRSQRQRQANEWARRDLRPPGTDDLVFTTTEATPIDPSNLRRQFAKLTEDAGPGTWHPLELRHSAASILSAALVYRHAITPTIATPTITTPNIMGNILGNDASPSAHQTPVRADCGNSTVTVLLLLAGK